LRTKYQQSTTDWPSDQEISNAFVAGAVSGGIFKERFNFTSLLTM